MVGLVSVWSHALAAILYGTLALWQLPRWSADPRSRRLILAFAVTSAAAAAVATLGPRHLLALLLSCGRIFAFLSFMYAVLCAAQEEERQQAVRVVYFTVAGVLGLQLAVAGTLPSFETVPLIYRTLSSCMHMLGLIVAAGCLILVHNIYAQAAPGSRWNIRLPMIGIAAMWVYDLHLNTIGYLSNAPVADLHAMQGAVLAIITPAFALAPRQDTGWKIRLSRAATFQSISAIAILVYLLLMMSAGRAIEIVGGQWARIGQIGLIFVMTLAAAVLLPSGRARAWLRVMLAKHLFQHRYDYREEWLRFTRTMSVAGEDVAPIENRVVKAMAELGDSPAALLLVPDPDMRLSPAASWNWPQLAHRSRAGEAEFARFLEATAHVVEFADVRSGGLSIDDRHVTVPEWMTADGLAWAGVPLIHNERLVGLVLLGHPLVRRPLDWEDYDLFRTAGKQAASYLAEARSHHALADAQRFEEFNRRFAFIMHDIKNLVSQISLVARNAERHADNPEFRADMVVTLQSSVKKMNDLLARLSRGNIAEAAAPTSLPLHDIAVAVADIKRRVHPVEIEGDPALAAHADRGRLEQALIHIVQNAIDASPAGRPVTIRIEQRDGEAAVDVIDRGSGMSAQFIRTRLFQPFTSTKEGGFGIGAFEARTLVASMGGRLDVESREGEGSRFTIFLPMAPSAAASGSRILTERMRA